MSKNISEKQHIRSMVTFSYLTLASLFTFVFTSVCILILLVPMVGILDFTYFPSKVGIPFCNFYDFFCSSF